MYPKRRNGKFARRYWEVHLANRYISQEYEVLQSSEAGLVLYEVSEESTLVSLGRLCVGHWLFLVHLVQRTEE